MHDTYTRFDPVSEDYSRFRPSYPGSLMRRLQQQFAATGQTPGAWIDVGCGTGIFTRQLAEVLPPDCRVLGLEPSAAMRAKAERLTAFPNVEYRNGMAETLPVADGSASAVSAATAAHWFDRPRFYEQAVRVLEPGGLLAIVQYVRDLERSPAAAALDAYLNEAGGPKAYRRPDYLAELAEVEGLELPMAWSTAETLHLDADAYVGLALSSSHAAACIVRLGEARVRADLQDLAGRHAASDGLVPYGYRFDLVSANKVRS